MLNRLLVRGIALFLGCFGRRRVAAALAGVVAALSRRLDPVESLRFLFDIDARLYPLQGEMAVAYGGGLHTKHRHMAYHDFFTQRIAASDSVLDVGCGNGAVAYDIATRCDAKVTGIDIDAGNIQDAKKNYSASNLIFIRGDAVLDLPSDHYDVIVLSNVLEHIEDRIGFLKELQRVTTPKRFLIRVPLFERDWRVPLKKELGAEWRLDSTHETEYTQESFVDEVTAVGLKIQHMEVRWGEIWCELCQA